MCNKSTSNNSCCNDSSEQRKQHGQPMIAAQSSSIASAIGTQTSRLCLICNNDNTLLLTSLKQNPHVINIQQDGDTELTIIVHDTNTSTKDLIDTIHRLGFNACTAPSTRQCFVKPADHVISFTGDRCDSNDGKNSCCKLEQASTESCCTAGEGATRQCIASHDAVQPQSAYWLRFAVMLSCFSICWEIIEGTTSVYFGSANGSVSLWEFGADSLIEMLSASLIVYRFYSQMMTNVAESNTDESNNRKERVVTFLVGLLLGLLSLATMAVSIHGLVVKSAPSSTIAGIIISAISFCIMFGLYISKTITGVRLSSTAVLSDAVCTYCCMQLSTCVFVSSMAFYFDQSLWWFDSAFALAISILIARESYGILKGVYTGQDTCCAPATTDSWLIKQIKHRGANNDAGQPIKPDETGCAKAINVKAGCSTGCDESVEQCCQ